MSSWAISLVDMEKISHLTQLTTQEEIIKDFSHSIYFKSWSNILQNLFAVPVPTNYEIYSIFVILLLIFALPLYTL
jgi:hypothetical protein